MKHWGDVLKQVDGNQGVDQCSWSAYKQILEGEGRASVARDDLRGRIAWTFQVRGGRRPGNQDNHGQWRGWEGSLIMHELMIFQKVKHKIPICLQLTCLSLNLPYFSVSGIVRLFYFYKDGLYLIKAINESVSSCPFIDSWAKNCSKSSLLLTWRQRQLS